MTWGQLLAKDMEEACQEMARRGLRLFQVMPVQTSSAWVDSGWDRPQTGIIRKDDCSLSIKTDRRIGHLPGYNS